ncbi:WD repeat domain phosphoinositide-interacting protein [Trichinella pseudospiralis]
MAFFEFMNKKFQFKHRADGERASTLKMMRERIHHCHSGASFCCISKQAFKTAALSGLSIFESLKRVKKANDAFRSRMLAGTHRSDMLSSILQP